MPILSSASRSFAICQLHVSAGLHVASTRSLPAAKRDDSRRRQRIRHRAVKRLGGDSSGRQHIVVVHHRDGGWPTTGAVQALEEAVVVAAALSDAVAIPVHGGGRHEDARNSAHHSTVQTLAFGFVDGCVVGPDEGCLRRPVHPAQLASGLADGKQDLVAGVVESCDQGHGWGFVGDADVDRECPG